MKAKPALLHFLGNLLIFIAASILVLTFTPVAKEEIKYQLKQTEKDLTPPNTDFSIVIPKIGAKAPVIADTDPFDPKKYLPALYKGVAHAKGTAYPGQFG